MRQLGASRAWCRAARIAVVHTTRPLCEHLRAARRRARRVPVRIGNRRELNPDKSRAQIAMQRTRIACAHASSPTRAPRRERLDRERVPAHKIAMSRTASTSTASPRIRPRTVRRVVVGREPAAREGPRRPHRRGRRRAAPFPDAAVRDRWRRTGAGGACRARVGARRDPRVQLRRPSRRRAAAARGRRHLRAAVALGSVSQCAARSDGRRPADRDERRWRNARVDRRRPHGPARPARRCTRARRPHRPADGRRAALAAARRAPRATRRTHATRSIAWSPRSSASIFTSSRAAACSRPTTRGLAAS